MQRFLEAAAIALQAIWGSKLRSLLTILGNVVAVSSIIAVVSLVQGLNASVADLIQSRFAADSFTVIRNPPVFTTDQERRVQSNPLVSVHDAETIRRLSPSVGLVMAEARAGGQVKYRGVTIDSVSVRGVTREYNDLPATRIAIGRPINSIEFDTGRQVAILGWDTADQLFGPLDPIEKTITVRGTHFRVVGVAPQVGSILAQSQDEFIVVPLPALRRLFGSRLGLQLTVRPTAPELVPTAIEETRVALRVERRLRPADPDNFGIASADTFLNLYTQVTAWIFAILVGVVSLSLVVGGIVIMNIMLMVVSERTREIGLRKSLGARRRDVLWQILTESVTLSIFGGIVGMIIGFLAAWIISQVSPLPMIVESWSVVLGITVTAAVGLFFGLYPAMRAAALDPIEALRRE
ncbi:MAG TPA: ABC transporter permease [Vicinamibacterales bacterium]|nr:ABC transporter permease [Vicinamibacterales bacterium]